MKAQVVYSQQKAVLCTLYLCICVLEFLGCVYVEDVGHAPCTKSATLDGQKQNQRILSTIYTGSHTIKCTTPAPTIHRRHTPTKEEEKINTHTKKAKKKHKNTHTKQVKSVIPLFFFRATTPLMARDEFSKESIIMTPSSF